MMLLRSCCCCSLRGGALAVGTVFLSLSVLQIFGVLIGWGAADATRAHYYQMMINEIHMDFYHGNHLPGVEILVPMTIFVLMQLAFDVLLVLGVYLSPTRPSAARRCVVSWIIFRAVLFGAISIGVFGLLVTALVMRYSGGERVSVMFGGFFVLAMVISGLYWYSWVVVLSFYWHLRAPETAGVAYNSVQMEATSAEPPHEAGQAAAFGQVSSSMLSGDGRSCGPNSGQKWA